MELWVAEYSQSQDAFHRQPLKSAIKSNFIRSLSKDKNDWVIIGIGSMEDVGKINDLARSKQ